MLEYWRQFRFLDEILRVVQPTHNSRSLDVGCGISTVLQYLPGYRFGIDPLADKYRAIYNYPNDISIQRAYGEDIPFEDNAFDFVVCSNCIDHTADPVQAIREIQRVLRNTGYFVLTCEVFSQSKGRRNTAHPHSMTEESLLQLVDRFALIRHWDSPWFGLQGYVVGDSPTSRREHIVLLRNS